MSTLPKIDNSISPWHVGHNGATVFTRHEAQRWCRELLQSEAYRASVERRMKADELAPAVECMMWHYGFGKPVEQVQLTVTQSEDLSALTVDQLLERAKALSTQLEEAQALANAIPGEILQGSW